jgi:uncharacterized protein (DUF486 family)
MWQIMFEYLIVVKIVTKIRLSCKCYTDGQRMNMYTLTVYIIYNPFGDIMLNHDLRFRYWVQLHLCNQGNFSYKCWLQLFYSCKLKL